MISYLEITKLYGVPITSLPPQTSNKGVSFTRVIIVIAILGIVVYGFYNSRQNSTAAQPKSD